MVAIRTKMRSILGIILLLLVVAGACGGSNEPASLDGRWDGGEDWGEVVIDGLSGTYSSTFGSDLGDISLTKVSDSEFTGTWDEGTLRFGTLTLKLDSNKKVTGEWTASPDSDVAGSSGGPLLWER